MDPASATTPTRTLTTALARGDDAAWLEFHRSHGPALFRHLLAHCSGDCDLAGEALQQAYLRIARHVRACDEAPMFAQWTRIVAVSALRDCQRRRKSFWNLLSRPEAAVAADDVSGKDERVMSALNEGLQRLEPAERALLEEKYLNGRDVRTLAGTLQLTPKAVESRLSRARAELRRHMIAMLARHE